MIELKRVTLDEIGGGVIPELFEHELSRVIDNIDDPNTDAAKPRKITIDIKFAPSIDRESAVVTVSVTAKLAGVKPAAATIFLTREAGVLTAYARDPRQLGLPLNVLEMKKGGTE